MHRLACLACLLASLALVALAVAGERPAPGRPRRRAVALAE